VCLDLRWCSASQRECADTVRSGKRKPGCGAAKPYVHVYGAATLIQFNDSRGHAAVLALFDAVIAAG
jgi:hypothetical protein